MKKSDVAWKLYKEYESTIMDKVAKDAWAWKKWGIMYPPVDKKELEDKNWFADTSTDA